MSQRSGEQVNGPYGASGIGPLSGVRVLDLTINVLGPVATQSLGDMGASVIKIEAPGGDPMRNNGPGRHPQMSVFFLNLNRNKKSVLLDLKQPADRDKLFALLEETDVFVHSMRSNAAERLGLNYEALSKKYPRLIFASAPGYNPTGPHRDRPAYDDVIQGESGIAGMAQMSTGVPAYFPTVMADKLCGVYLASAISMALYSRERTGVGQQVLVPMYETMLSFNLLEHMWTGALGEEGHLGYTRALSVHRKPFPTLDGHICLLAISDDQWRRLFGVFERPDLAADARFSTLLARAENIELLYTIVGEHISTRSTAAWRHLLDEVDIPNGPMNRLNDLPLDPYLKETNFFEHYQHPSEGPLVRTAIPLHFSQTPGSIRTPPPRLGEHTEEVLRSIQVQQTSSSKKENI